jgi:hypothetical protein
VTIPSYLEHALQPAIATTAALLGSADIPMGGMPGNPASVHRQLARVFAIAELSRRASAAGGVKKLKPRVRGQAAQTLEDVAEVRGALARAAAAGEPVGLFGWGLE